MNPDTWITRPSAMRICARWTASILLTAACLTVQAQYGLQSSQLGGMVWSQKFQPANIAGGEFEKFRYAGGAEGYFGNTDCSLAGVFAENGYITNATKERILADIKDDLQVTGGYGIDLAAVNVKVGSATLAFNVSTGLNVNAHISNGNTLGLLLLGNKAYAGQTVRDSGAWGNLTQTRSIGVGAGWKFDKLQVGGRVNLIQGVRSFDASDLSYDLYTETDGLEVNLDAQYAIRGTNARAGFFQFGGMGASLDLGASYDISEKLRVDAAVTGLGMISWKGSEVSDDVSVQWTGISIASLLEDSLPAAIQHQVDSIKNLILPDTIPTKWMTGTPLQIRIAARYKIGEHGSLGLLLVYAPGIAGPRTAMPLASVNYQHEVATGLVFGGNAYFGGYDGFGFGAMGKYTIDAGALKINLLAGSDNLLGFIASNLGRGFSAYGGVGVDF